MGDHCLSRRRPRPTLGISSQTARWPHGCRAFFYDLNYQEDRWRCLPADNARSTQLEMREPIGYSLDEKSDTRRVGAW
jgi:hypothetical protein